MIVYVTFRLHLSTYQTAFTEKAKLCNSHNIIFTLVKERNPKYGNIQDNEGDEGEFKTLYEASFSRPGKFSNEFPINLKPSKYGMTNLLYRPSSRKLTMKEILARESGPSKHHESTYTKQFNASHISDVFKRIELRNLKVPIRPNSTIAEKYQEWKDA